MQIVPLGDQAVLAYCDDEAAASAYAAAVRQGDWPWVVDVVQAYTSVAIFLDGRAINYFQALKDLEGCPAVKDETSAAPRVFSFAKQCLVT